MVEPFPEFCGCTSYDFGKDPAEIIPAAKAELFGKCLDRKVGITQKRFGASDFGSFYIIINAKTGFLFEFVR